MSVIAKPRKGRPWLGIGPKRHRNESKIIIVIIIIIIIITLQTRQYYVDALFCINICTGLKNSLSTLESIELRVPIRNVTRKIHAA
jgi:hypothetical protein